jgi:hypothetical protein
MDERDVLQLALRSRQRLDAPLQRELAAARTMEPVLSEMYFQVFNPR